MTMIMKKKTTTKITMLTFALTLVTLAAGCGRSDAVRVYESWADDACACKDAECVTKQETALGALAKKYTGVKMQRADSEAIQAAGQRGSTCLVDLHTSLSK
jgi:hypothetical protein